MVLRYRHWAALAALLLCGCPKRMPMAHLAQPTPVAVAYVADRHDAPGGEVNEALMGFVEEALAQRNLAPNRLPRDSYAHAFEQVRTTQQRLAQVAALAGEAPLVLLVEVKPVFYDILSGRFKWTVYTKLTLASRTDLNGAMTESDDFSVFLQLERDKELEAQAVAAPPIAERAGLLVDTYLSGRAEFPRSEASASRKRIGPGDAIYFVMVDRFANGDRSNDGTTDLADPAAFHGGDLQGVIDHLDDIQKLGFTTVWLSPVWKMRTEKFFGHGAFHGYWVDDFTRVEPRFGDRRLLRRLSDELHRRGMKLVLDVVLNHVGFDSPLLKQHPDWFHHNGEIKDWNDRAQLENNDVMGLPDLAQENEAVYRYLLQASEQWIDEIQPDGFRLDAVKHVPLAFWARYNRDIHAHAGADFWLLGEALEGDPVRVARVWREGGFDAMFDFPLYYAITDVFCKGAPVGRLAATLSQDSAYPDASQLVTLVDNHDLPRLMSACGGSEDKAASALTLLFLVRGIPSVTYGTEVGLTGEKEPENRGDMRFRLRPLVAPAAYAQALGESGARAGASRVSSYNGEAFAVVRTSGVHTLVIGVNPRGIETEARFPAACAGAAPSTERQPLMTSQPMKRTVESWGLLVADPHSCRDWLRDGGAEVVIRVQGAPVGAGDTLAVVGAGSELGNWEPARAPSLREVKDSALRGRLDLADGVHAFKLVVRHADGSVEWENRSDRFLFVSGERPVSVDATWSKE